MIDLLDSDLLALEKVVEHLKLRQATSVPLEAFRKEAVERFVAAGFVVEVQVWDTDQPGMFAFDIEIIDRTEAKTFDHDQMAWEATHDILGLGEGGIINTNTKEFTGGCKGGQSCTHGGLHG